MKLNSNQRKGETTRGSGVWFAASRHKFSVTILPDQTTGSDGGYEADRETRSAARETRALPKNNRTFALLR